MPLREEDIAWPFPNGERWWVEGADHILTIDSVVCLVDLIKGFDERSTAAGSNPVAGVPVGSNPVRSNPVSNPVSSTVSSTVGPRSVNTTGPTGNATTDTATPDTATPGNTAGNAVWVNAAGGNAARGNAAGGKAGAVSWTESILRTVLAPTARQVTWMMPAPDIRRQAASVAPASRL